MKILLIEDEPPAARRLEKLLERLLQDLGEWGRVPAEMTWIGDADLALEEAAKNPDLIFLDLNLEGFHSLEWLREARLPAERVILVSADTRHCDEAFTLGVFAYLFKPVEAGPLEKELVRFLNTRGLIA